ncbi:nucleotide-binding domain-containing protein [Schizophyllum commune Loenen D]|nr:nucleotide-binding domain-containing protein [Schizophyllum commune Loenen D]
MSSTRKNVVVIGAGVTGLTTAVSLQEQGDYDVTVLADIFPSDPKSVNYTSHWAGAILLNGMSGVDGARNQLMIDVEKESFDVHWKAAESDPDVRGYRCLPATIYLSAPLPDSNPITKFPDANALPSGISHGISFTTLTIDPPLYLNYLSTRFIAAGGTLARGSVSHINVLLEGGANIFRGCPAEAPAAIINCSGLGARTLGGVDDGKVFPVRGQSVRIHAPWVKEAIMSSGGSGEEHTGIFPRASGDVYLVGTKHTDDWYLAPRPEIARGILERTFAICPDIAPPEVRAAREPTLDDVLPLIVEEGVGRRPARKGGLRIETEWFETPKGDKVPVVHNYGHAGSGYECSWGSASRVLDKLSKALA